MSKPIEPKVVKMGFGETLPRCERMMATKKWPFIKRCNGTSTVRVRLFNSDDTTEDMDLCADCHLEAAGVYLDNIKELVRYERYGQ